MSFIVLGTKGKEVEVVAKNVGLVDAENMKQLVESEYDRVVIETFYPHLFVEESRKSKKK